MPLDSIALFGDRKKRLAPSVVAVAALACGFAVAAQSPTPPSESGGESVLWYRSAAPQWDHAMPLGNGRLGAMVFGSVNRERIQLNEETLWMGGPRETDNPEALAALPEVRRLLFAATRARRTRWPRRS